MPHVTLATVSEVHDALHLHHGSCSAVPEPMSLACGSEWRAPVCDANTTSAHVNIGAVGLGVSAASAAVASPPARRRLRAYFVLLVFAFGSGKRVTPVTATHRAPAG